MNNRRPERKGYVVPGISESYHVLGEGFGSAAVRISATQEQFNYRIKDAIEEEIKRIKEKNNDLASKIMVKYDQRGFVELALGGYRSNEDDDAVEILNSLSKFVYKTIQGKDVGAPVVIGAEKPSLNKDREFNHEQMYDDPTVIAVRQGTYGELTEETIKRGFKKMETGGMGPCVGLILIGGEKGEILLAHIDIGRRLNSIEYWQRYNQAKKAVIVASMQSSEETLRKVEDFARRHAKGVEIIRQQSLSAKIGVDVGGQVYVPDKLINGLTPEDPIGRRILEFSLVEDALSPNPKLRPTPLPPLVNKK